MAYFGRPQSVFKSFIFHFQAGRRRYLSALSYAYDKSYHFIFACAMTYEVDAFSMQLL